MAGALKQFVITLNGGIQQLEAAVLAAYPNTDRTQPYSEMRFTQQGAAAAFIGEAGSGVSATNYAVTAPAAAAREAVLTARGGTKLRLKDLEIIGTNTQVLSIAAMVY